MTNPEIILYPTESVYGLGVNPFDGGALEQLYQLKGRVGDKPVSWLVRSVADIERYAHVDDIARRLIARFLPGPADTGFDVTSFVPSVWSQRRYYWFPDDD